MITAHEIKQALTGVVLLARGDPSGVGYFNDTPRDFWRSFWAAAIVAPMWLLLIALVVPDTDASPLRLMLAETVEYALLWTAFPLVLHEILSRSGTDEHFCRYIAAHNWASVIVTPAMLIAVVLAASVPSEVARILPLLVMVSSIAYEWLIARVALAVSVATAAGVAAMDFFLGYTINLTIEALLGARPAIEIGIGQ